MLAATADAAHAIFDVCYSTIYITVNAFLWVVTSLIPQAFTFLLDVLSLVWSALLQVIQTATTVVLQIIDLLTSIFSSSLPVLEGIARFCSETVPLILTHISSGVQAMLSVGWNLLSAAYSGVVVALKYVIDGLSYVLSYAVPAVLRGVETMLVYLWYIAKALGNGLLTVLSAVWTGVVFVFVTLVSTVNLVANFTWSIVSTVFSGEVKSAFESFGSDSTQVRHRVGEWGVTTMQTVVVIIQVLCSLLALLVVTGIILYYIKKNVQLIKNYWGRLWQYQQPPHPPPPLQPARQPPVDHARQNTRASVLPNPMDPLQRGATAAPLNRRLSSSSESLTSSSSLQQPGQRGGGVGAADQGRLCVVCWDNDREVLLRPCNHYCVCTECCRQLGGKCPMCRRTFTNSERIYI